jgi:hypothetical protein
MPPRKAATALLPAFVAAAVLAAGIVHARENIRTSFFNVYPSAATSTIGTLPSNDNHCGVCHFDFNGGGPRNPHGVRVGQVLGSYGNNDAGRQAAIRSIENEDPDGDGVSTKNEVTDTATYINTPTFPGLTPSNVGSVSNVSLAEIDDHLVPTTGGDTTPPSVLVLSPNGGETFTAGTGHTITWTAGDPSGVMDVDLYYREPHNPYWTPLALATGNWGTFTWFVHNTPTTQARVLVVARDVYGNVGRDSSDAVFTIAPQPGGIAPTTLRDFDMPGTQPLGSGTFEHHFGCTQCHGDYDPAVEPGHNWKGSMMAQAAHDPLFYACLTVANQDAPGGGDMCVRCHSPMGWLMGRSQPTDASQLQYTDRDGVSCEFCHRLVDPLYKPGVSPAEDEAILAGLLPAHAPTGYSNGQYVTDPQSRRRGPFTDPASPHAFLYSPFHRSAELCGTCHDVSNPVFTRVGDADYAVNTLDQAADSISSLTLFPLERTYSEWKNSAFPAGVYAPEFAGNRPDGMVRVCQDCHMRAVEGVGCNTGTAPVRPDLPLHDLTGGNAWMPMVIASVFPDEVDPVALESAAGRAVSMLEKAALLEVAVEPAGDGYVASVTVTNKTGHKLPTGYPEGRRMWLQVVARDENGAVVYESGAYDAATGVLTEDADAVIYEAHLGISPGLGGLLGQPHGPSFHFALNDSLYKDNRIPPAGFTHAAFAAFGGAPVDPHFAGPGPRYADGQNYDVASYALPASARSVVARLLYQTTSKEYVEFLRDQNVTDTRGQVMYDAWVAHGRAAPVVMVGDSTVITPVAVEDDAAPARSSLALGANPFRGALDLRLSLASAARVELEVFDLSGRRVDRDSRGTLAAGTHALRWDARGVDAGVYWVQVRAGEWTFTRRVVRLE